MVELLVGRTFHTSLISLFKLFFRSFFYEPFVIPASSMTPTFNQDDYVVVSKYGYGLYGTYGIKIYETDIEKRMKPSRGDVFVFYPPNEEQVF
jgi:signal peptidase I